MNGLKIVSMKHLMVNSADQQGEGVAGRGGALIRDGCREGVVLSSKLVHLIAQGNHVHSDDLQNPCWVWRDTGDSCVKQT